MNKTILSIAVFLVLIGCSSVKKAQQAINTGDYDKAINLAISNLSKNKFKKSNQPYIFMLEDSYSKASKRDLERITFLKKDNNPEKLEEIFNIYSTLINRQEAIKPLLPLFKKETNQQAVFVFNDYADDFIEAKNSISSYLLSKSEASLSNVTSKLAYRAIYDDLMYIEKINPNYKNVLQLSEEAYGKGLDYVIVSLKNDSQKVIPKKLATDLLNFDTNGIRDFWTVYHNRKIASISYDFSLELTIRSIVISPERISEKQITKEKSIKDGFKFLLDKDGNQVKDKNGKNIKVDKFKTVTCQLDQFIQFKSVNIVGNVSYVDLTSNQLVKTFPIESGYVFEHSYAEFNGDKRALDTSFLGMIDRRLVEFPSNEQMIFDAGNDLKAILKDKINRNKFRG